MSNNHGGGLPLLTDKELEAGLALHAAREIQLPSSLTLGSAHYDTSHLLLLGELYDLKQYRSFRLLMAKLEASSIGNTLKEFDNDLRVIMTRAIQSGDDIARLFSLERNEGEASGERTEQPREGG